MQLTEYWAEGNSIHMSKIYHFEDYLKDVHAEDYHGTDDDMPDVFDDWLGELDNSDLETYADAFGKKKYEEGRKAVLQEFDFMCIADAFLGFTSAEWTAIKKFFNYNKELTGWNK